MKHSGPTMHPVWLIVLEVGAAWPAWVDTHRAGEELAIVVEQVHETAAKLVARIRLLALRLSGNNREILAAVLAVSPKKALQQRVILTQELFRTVRPEGGTLTMSHPGASLDERHQLLALVGTLTDQYADSRTGTTVLLHFDASV